MIITFSVANHRSIKNKVEFSMVATIDESIPKSIYHFQETSSKSIPINKCAEIYGANGSGKSSFLGSIGQLKGIVSDGMKLEPGDRLTRQPHKLSFNEPTIYNIKFITQGVRYSYYIEYLDEEILKEYLYYFPKGRQAKIFERKRLDIEISSTFEKELKLSLNLLKANRPFISCAASYSNLDVTEKAYLFFKNDIVIYNEHFNNWSDYTAEKLQTNEALRKSFVLFMQSIGSDLKEIDSQVLMEKIDANKITKNVPLELKGVLTELINVSNNNGGSSRKIKADFKYEKFCVEFNNESTGTKKLFSLFGPIIDIIENDKVLICDELENSIHVNIIYELIRLFQMSVKSQQSQLIFTTHNASLLNLGLFRRDQIWFSELMPQERNTDLYSLIELKNIRKDENIYKGYIKGKYGGIPILKANIKDVVGEYIVK